MKRRDFLKRLGVSAAGIGVINEISKKHGGEAAESLEDWMQENPEATPTDLRHEANRRGWLIT